MNPVLLRNIKKRRIKPTMHFDLQHNIDCQQI
jgi:hypothetical protein